MSLKIEKAMHFAKVDFLTDYNANKNKYLVDSLNWNVGDIKIDFQATSNNLLDKLYNLQDFKYFTNPLVHPIV